MTSCIHQLQCVGIKIVWCRNWCSHLDHTFVASVWWCWTCDTQLGFNIYNSFFFSRFYSGQYLHWLNNFNNIACLVQTTDRSQIRRRRPWNQNWFMWKKLEPLFNIHWCSAFWGFLFYCACPSCCPSPGASILIFFQLTSAKNKYTGEIICHNRIIMLVRRSINATKAVPFYVDLNNCFLWATAYFSHLSGFPRQDLACLFFIQRETSFRNPLNSNHNILPTKLPI